MLKKPASGVLGSSKSSTYPRGYASGFDSPAALLDSLFELPAGVFSRCATRADLEALAYPDILLSRSLSCREGDTAGCRILFGLRIALRRPDIRPVPLTVIPEHRLPTLNRRHIVVDDRRGHALRHIAQNPRAKHMNPGKHARQSRHLICASTTGNPHDTVVRIHFDETPPYRFRIFAQDQRRHGLALLMTLIQRTEVELYEGIAVKHQHRFAGEI